MQRLVLLATASSYKAVSGRKDEKQRTCADARCAHASSSVGAFVQLGATRAIGIARKKSGKNRFIESGSSMTIAHSHCA
jgi:hypothetical protein